MPRNSSAVWVVAALLAVLLLVVAGVGGYFVVQHLRGEERRKDEIRIKQLDREIDDLVFPAARGEGLILINEKITEQNALVRKWPELHRVEQKLIQP